MRRLENNSYSPATDLALLHATLLSLKSVHPQFFAPSTINVKMHTIIYYLITPHYCFLNTS